ncbi:family 1 glycosylhydrolase [Actinomadura chokoriensis]|uniref:Family 1 glycosylhydrolase n=1 Tax=Actinomadura chokoriensis TaxID=454156 RepID=A0ABV4R8S6_9ACTN
MFGWLGRSRRPRPVPPLSVRSLFARSLFARSRFVRSLFVRSLFVRSLFVRSVSARSLAVLVLVAGLLVAPSASAAGGPATGRFPPGFLWGVSTSGFQSEGFFPDSNWTRYADRKANGVTDPYGNSVDFLHRYPADLKLAKQIGVNVFRTSVEWARVEPRRGYRDPKALAYYDDLIRSIKANGMRPMLTLDH